MPVPTTIPTGRNNMLASLRKYLTDNLPSDTVVFEQWENVQKFPSISFEDVGIPGFGSHAFDDYLGQEVDSNGAVIGDVYGKIAQTNIELNCMSDSVETGVKDVYQMADRLEYLFMYSGRTDANGNLILPRISILDFDNSQNDTGSYLWAPSEKDSIWMPNYVGTVPEMPQVRRLRILVRIYWYLLRT